MKKIKPEFASNVPGNRIENQFNYEVGEAKRLQHERLIQILGYSNDVRECPCLIYPYMRNGTLESRLAASDPDSILSAVQRMKILIGVAEGLEFLHTRPKPLIHRDVKSANVLLDDSLLPKVI